MRAYTAALKMSTERKTLEAVQRRLERVREVAERQGFHISELAVRSDDGVEAEVTRSSAGVSR